MPEDECDSPAAGVMPSGTLIAFDFGHRRIGVAVGQTLTCTANALQVVAVAGAGAPDWQAISVIIKDWKPAALVVGLPLGVDGEETEMSRAARQFAHQLESRYQLQVLFEDERLTSFSAEQRFVAARARGSLRRKDAALKDAMAAQIILEIWLGSAP